MFAAAGARFYTRMMFCHECGHSAPDGAKFCQECGTRLAGGGPPVVEQLPVETRRNVTVLFIDVTGSTPLGERLDPEAVRRILSRYFGEVATIVARHGGTLEKFAGDALVAVFGLPVLHEDDALRAVRAAVEARNASSSCRTGRPKTATSASPANFSSVPP